MIDRSNDEVEYSVYSLKKKKKKVALVQLSTSISAA